MSAYVLAQLQIDDPDEYQNYLAGFMPIFERHGGELLATSKNKTIVVEGNHYFPADSVNKEYLEDSDLYTICPWKGTASYYSLNVDGKTNVDAAWFYPEAKKMASNIENYIAFWRGVQISD